MILQVLIWKVFYSSGLTIFETEGLISHSRSIVIIELNLQYEDPPAVVWNNLRKVVRRGISSSSFPLC
jgi:hypothetical protein